MVSSASASRDRQRDGLAGRVPYGQVPGDRGGGVGCGGGEQGEGREQRGDQGASGTGEAHGRVSVSKIKNRL
jgi:hypothetical protein